MRGLREKEEHEEHGVRRKRVDCMRSSKEGGTLNICRGKWNEMEGKFPLKQKSNRDKCSVEGKIMDRVFHVTLLTINTENVKNLYNFLKDSRY